MGLVVKNPPAIAGDIRDSGSILGSGRPPEVGPGNPLQYSCLENPHGQRSLAGYSPRGREESDKIEQQSTVQHKGERHTGFWGVVFLQVFFKYEIISKEKVKKISQTYILYHVF